MEKKRLTRNEIYKMVQEARRAPKNVIAMIVKHGERAALNVHHGQLHLDFDDRSGSSYNNDLLKMMPFNLKHPVCFTSWKGAIYAHSLDNHPMDFTTCKTGDILTEVIMRYGETTQRCND